MKEFQERGKIKKCGWITQTDAEAVLSDVLVFNAGNCHLGFFDNILCIFVKCHSCGSQLDVPGRTDEEPGLEFMFQCTDLFGHGRLGDIEGFRSACKAEIVCNKMAQAGYKDCRSGKNKLFAL